jgi:hypothetical protein
MMAAKRKAAKRKRTPKPDAIVERRLVFPPIPPEVAEEIVELLAEMLVADYRRRHAAAEDA